MRAVTSPAYAEVNVERPTRETRGEARGGWPSGRGDLLAGPALRTWAHDLLGRLEQDGRDPRGTLRAWIAAGGNAERAAQALGVPAQTVRDHVRGAEPVLERRLLAAGTDLYEVVLAHLAVGDLTAPEPGRAKQGSSDAPVHG